VLRLSHKSPKATSLQQLAALQARIDAKSDFATRATEGKRLWDSCRIPDECLLHNRSALLVGREVLVGLLTELSAPRTA
jgi:hypothetical protein